ncbi:MAG: hypothetical protein V1821_01905 [bacterium]
MRKIVAGLALMFCGCATSGGLQTGRTEYRTQYLEVPAAQTTVFRAVLEEVYEEGWSATFVDETRGVMEVVTPTSVEDGVAIRERWEFLAQDRKIGVRRYLEARFDLKSGAWERNQEVCAHYKYVAERRKLRDIERRVGRRALKYYARAPG